MPTRVSALTQPRLMHPGDTHWPTSLYDLGPIAPRQLLAVGDTTLLESSALTAIIGGRTATTAGRATGSSLAAALAARGEILVTPAATGTDLAVVDAAHRAQGRIVAIAPPAHHRTEHVTAAIQRRVLEHDGLLVWEARTDRDQRGSARGEARLLAAIAPRLVLVEIGPRSPGIAAAAIAGGLSRTVAVTPTDRSHPGRGSEQLLTAGMAVVVRTADELDALSDPRALAHL